MAAWDIVSESLIYEICQTLTLYAIAGQRACLISTIAAGLGFFFFFSFFKLLSFENSSETSSKLYKYLRSYYVCGKPKRHESNGKRKLKKKAKIFNICTSAQHYIGALVKFWMILRGEFNAHAPMITFYGAARHTLPEATQKSQGNISTLFISTAMPIYHGYPTGMSIMFP